MIDIKSLPKPTVLGTIGYEEILQQNIDNMKAVMPDWTPLSSDDQQMMLEAFSYRELHLRVEFNKLSEAFFLITSKAADLDYRALSEYGILRLQGSKPYAPYEFTLSEIFDYDVVIPVNLILTDETSTYEGKLLSDVTIVAGTDKATGVVELQLETSSSAIKTEFITTTLPFVTTAKATDIFNNGSDVEDDETFIYRILLSMADKSTAGSEETYESYTYNADERIEDVKIASEASGTVNVYYYSEVADALMKTRIEEKLNAKEVRPLTDIVVVNHVSEVPYNITAELKILPDQETATVYSNAVLSLDAGLKSLKQIGTDITLSEINDFLKVYGVKEVVLSVPSENIIVENNQIGVNGANTITYTVL